MLKYDAELNQRVVISDPDFEGQRGTIVDIDYLSNCVTVRLDENGSDVIMFFDEVHKEN